MIYKFTNSKGAVNHGLIIERVATGYYILFDSFDIAPGVQLPVRYSFVTGAPNGYVLPNDSRREVLPLDTPVRWQDHRMAEAHRRMQAGTFGDWWQQNRIDIISGSHRYQEPML